MPGMSGIEVTKRLKEVRPGLFICLITGFDDPRIAVEGRNAGADGYFTKPFLEKSRSVRNEQLGHNPAHGPDLISGTPERSGGDARLPPQRVAALERGCAEGFLPGVHLAEVRTVLPASPRNSPQSQRVSSLNPKP